MTRVARILLFMIALMVLAASTAAACNGANPPRPLKLGSWEDKLTLYLKAETSTSSPSLQRDAGSFASVTQFSDASWGPSSGVASGAGRIAGQAMSSVEFRTPAPLGGVHYLNLSKPVWGSLFFTSTPGQSASRGDAVDIRIEVFTGTKRVGGAEYIQPASGSRAAGWFQWNYCFRPEVVLLDPAQPMIVKITRKAGSADFLVGTGDPKQSFLEIRYFTTDPLDGALYVENGKLIKGVGTPEPEEESSDGFAALAAVPLLLLASAGVGLRRRPGVLLAGLMVFATVASGCVSDSPTTTETRAGAKTPGASISYEDEDPENKAAGRGSLQGLVMDETGIPLKGAHVALLGTNRFSTTSKDGKFAFPNLTARDYTVRVDAEGFIGSETRVVVEEGKVATISIRLPYPEREDANAKPHSHDDWGEDVEKTPISKNLQPVWSVGSSADLGATVDFNVPIALQLAGSGSDRACSRLLVCRWQLPLDEGVVILPGTSVVELTLTWTGSQAYKELGLQVLTASNRSSIQYFVPRPSGDPFRIAIFPTEADPGHQKFTDWTFTVILPPLPAGHPFGAPLETAAPIQVKMVIRKGVVPFEPAHRDFWNGAKQLTLFQDRQLGPSACVNCDLPTSWGYDFRLPADEFVPAETTVIKGTLRWTGVAESQTGLTPWGLVYRAANMPSWGMNFPKVTVDSRANDRIEFTILVQDKEGDQYYQARSRWIFFIDDGDQPQKGVSTGYGTRWFLTATAFRDPPV
jgi:hypothetical protein